MPFFKKPQVKWCLIFNVHVDTFSVAEATECLFLWYQDKAISVAPELIALLQCYCSVQLMRNETQLGLTFSDMLPAAFRQGALFSSFKPLAGLSTKELIFFPCGGFTIVNYKSS